MYCYTRLYILESTEQQYILTVHVVGEKDMTKTKLFTTALILLTLTLTQIAFTQNISPAAAASTSTVTLLKIYAGPNSVPDDNLPYNIIAVQLEDARGVPVRAKEDTTILLSSSLISVGTADPTVTIPKGSTMTTANFYSTYTPGTTTITAAATNCTSNQASITTVGPIPSKLAVYCTPSALPADGNPSDILQVQLQDSRGKPAKDPLGDIIVNLFSSNPDAGNVSSTLMLPFGETFSVGAFYTTCIGNLTTITAQARGYDPGQAKIWN